MIQTKPAPAVPGFDYAPSPETTPVKVRDRYGLFIGGDWVAPKSGECFATINPATEEKLADVAFANAEDVDRAVEAARRAYDKYWRKMPGSERAKYVYRIGRALTERSREFAVLESMDGGKPIRESRDFDVPQAAAHFFYHAGWADKLEWAVQSPERIHSLGVVGAIVPWNFPLLIATWKIAPALACGNTIVLKPAETTPLTALLLAQVIQEADLPPGVVNVVTGDGRTGSALVEHNDTELGGKAALIVYDDAPLDQVIEGIVSAIYFNQGHVCCAGSRLLLQEPIYEEIIERLHARIETLRLGNPLDKNTDIGAINSRMQRDRIVEMVNSGISEGAHLVQASCPLPERGYWYPASFFTNVQPTHRIAREEIFGPVLSIMTFRTADEAIERANNLPYGLSAGIWTASGQLGMYTAARMQAGVVWCNTFNQFDPSSPFGGYKESGFGREGGLAGLRDYLR